MTVRKYILLSISLCILVYVLRNGAFLFILLAAITVFINKYYNSSKFTCVIGVLLYIIGFLFAKVQTQDGVFMWGYSVFAFSGISFLIEQYRQKKNCSISATLLYLFFFPKMFAGPIVRPEEFIPQLSKKAIYNRDTIYRAFKIITYALFLKFFIADNLVLTGDTIGINLFMSSLVWGIRFYFDFYAYSLLAVGAAMLCGIHLPFNFNNPYYSGTFREFWKRWNITLSAWLRDYTYIPLGGNRKGTLRTSINIVVVFVISGLWHGLTFPFVIWGLCHALLVCIEKIVIIPQGKIAHYVYGIFVTITTLLLWQLFTFNDSYDIVIYFYQLCSISNINVSVTFTLLIAISMLLVVESNAVKALVFENRKTQSSIICEVVMFTLMLITFVLIPNHYSFNFFYLNF